ncbi:hypothetical protein IPA_00880 [Ignicoccus pacificus DSM 13166]|uniref:Glycosyltransferase 2-like domain-containing protein n=1 Tax=Ignicoccus pacificus DSM 13166 TaxID=940294 RepID=A0A977KAD4_9CREN|nr:hypothetical protein IPA_00880 [Ignicoccus pacificus DSM 13166]
MLQTSYAIGALLYTEGDEDEDSSLSVHIPAYREDVVIVKRTVENVKNVLNPKEIIVVTDPYSFKIYKNELKGVKLFTGAEKGKAHALNVALEHTEAEKVLVLDADSFPDKGFKIGKGKYLATPWKGYSAGTRWSEAIANLTTLASILLTKGRKALGLTVLAPGSGVAADAELLKEMRWDESVKTEDLELGIRMHNLGIRANLNKGYVLVEAPPGYFELKRQQRRWTYGAIQVLKRVKIKRLRDLELFFYLTQYSYTWLPLLALLTSPLGLSPLSLLLYYGSVTLQGVLTALVQRKYKVRMSLADASRSSAAGLAMSLSLLEASIRGLMGLPLKWKVTPKGGKREGGKLREEYLLLFTPIFSIINPISLPLSLQYLASSLYLIKEIRRD